MKQFKEKPKMGKVKEKSKSALLPRQAVHMMKEKYIKELDQRPRGADGEGQTAPDQVERSGRWAADELTGRTVEQGREYVKKKFAARGKVQADPVPISPEDAPVTEVGQEGAPIPEQPHSVSRDCRTAERRANAPKERPQMERTATNPIKDRQTVERRASAQRSQPYRTTQPPRNGQAAPHSGAYPLRERTSAHEWKERPRIGAARSTTGHTAAAPGKYPETPPPKSQRQKALKERPRTALRERGTSSVPASVSDGKAPRSAKASASPKVRRGVFRPTVKPAARSAAPATRAAKAAKRQMQRRIFTQAAKPVKSVGIVLRRAVQAVAKAASAVTGAVSAIIGGCVLLVALVVIIVIAAVVSSPFGLFFAQEPNGPNSVSVSQAVGSVNMAYNARLELLQAGDYDSIDIQGAAPDWPDVLAVFAVKVAGADVGGMDVATLDTDRVDKLTAVFWDMTTLTSAVETIPHADSDPNDDIDDSWTEHILHITITPKTADDMRTAYAFTAYQNSALDELLADRAALSSMAGSLTITSADVLAVLQALPDDLSPERRAVVEKVLSLVGKVNYFWGGKSYVIGWDPRWGTIQKVTSPGSSTSGTYRPYGLDCSGFLDWALRNAGLHSDGHWYIGRNLTAVSQADALPGDFALYPDASHVGLIVGRNEAGKLLVCHCSYGMNNVVVTEFSASGFTAVGRQPFLPG